MTRKQLEPERDINVHQLDQDLSTQVGNHDLSKAQLVPLKDSDSILSRAKTNRGVNKAKLSKSGGVKRRKPKANKIGIEVINAKQAQDIRIAITKGSSRLENDSGQSQVNERESIKAGLTIRGGTVTESIQRG